MQSNETAEKEKQKASHGALAGTHAAEMMSHDDIDQVTGPSGELRKHNEKAVKQKGGGTFIPND